MGRCVIDRPMNEVISFLEDHERRKEWDKYLAVCHIYVQVLCSYYNFPIQEIRILKRISNTDFICKFTESQEEINVSPNLINRLYASGSKTLLGETEKGYGCFCTKCQCCKLFIAFIEPLSVAVYTSRVKSMYALLCQLIFRSILLIPG